MGDTRRVEAGGPERRVNLHTSPKMMRGVYANFANVSTSDYEFALTFARVEHEVDESELPGIVVANINMSPRFARELIDALEDAWSKWETRQGIKNLPEYSRDDEQRDED
jgi:formate-dependent phosphoribosylglycinamide formyltransferase (GAR transformylase)